MLTIVVLTLGLVTVHSIDRKPCEETLVYNLQSIQVSTKKVGQKCKSDCSYISKPIHGNQTQMPCTVEECGEKVKSLEFSQCPDVMDVSFIKLSKKKIAVRVRWSPTDYGDVEFTTGYCFEIRDALKRYSRCYYLHRPMNWSNNRHDVFENDCFLPSQSKRKPIYPIYISISSLPLPLNASQSYCQRNIRINVPKRGWGFVKRTYCENSSVEYLYGIESRFGSYAKIGICQINSDENCTEARMTVLSKINATGTLYNLTFGDEFHERSVYRIFLYGKYGDPLNVSEVDFSGCPDNVSRAFTQIVITAVVIGTALFLVALLVIGFRKVERRKKNLSASEAGMPLHSREVSRSDDGTKHSSVSFSEEETEAEELNDFAACVNSMESPSVLVLFTEDNDKHIKVVETFCNFLQINLGLRVKLPLWDYAGDFGGNVNEYITRNLEEADKILLICSERTKNCASAQDADLDERQFNFAVNCAINHALNGQSSRKFIVCYFNYSPRECIPNGLDEIYWTKYNLMENFKDLYFHIIGSEKYFPDGKIKVVKELEGKDPDGTVNEVWADLQKGIEEAKNFAAETLERTNSDSDDPNEEEIVMSTADDRTSGIYLPETIGSYKDVSNSSFSNKCKAHQLRADDNAGPNSPSHLSPNREMSDKEMIDGAFELIRRGEFLEELHRTSDISSCQLLDPHYPSITTVPKSVNDESENVEDHAWIPSN